MDLLHSLGHQGGSRGAPQARRQFGAQIQHPIRSDARAGQQLGDAAVRVTRSSFLRNLEIAAVAITRGRLRIGHPEAPAGSGWDGKPLDGSAPGSTLGR